MDEQLVVVADSAVENQLAGGDGIAIREIDRHVVVTAATIDRQAGLTHQVGQREFQNREAIERDHEVVRRIHEHHEMVGSGCPIQDGRDVVRQHHILVAIGNLQRLTVEEQRTAIGKSRERV